MALSDANDIAVICETVICLALIGAGTFLVHRLVSRLAAVKQATAGGRNGTRVTTPATVTETAAMPPLAPVETQTEGSAA